MFCFVCCVVFVCLSLYETMMIWLLPISMLSLHKATITTWQNSRASVSFLSQTIYFLCLKSGFVTEFIFWITKETKAPLKQPLRCKRGIFCRSWKLVDVYNTMSCKYIHRSKDKSGVFLWGKVKWKTKARFVKAVSLTKFPREIWNATNHYTQLQTLSQT